MCILAATAGAPQDRLPWTYKTEVLEGYWFAAFTLQDPHSAPVAQWTERLFA